MSLSLRTAGSFGAVEQNFSKLNSSVKTVTTTTYTVAATDSALILSPTAAMVMTLPNPATSMGRSLRLKLTLGHAITSASANVMPLASSTPTTAIMTAVVGKYCLLQSDGTYWQIMSAN